MPNQNIIIDHENKIINVAGKNILLSEKEFRLFLLFYENPDSVFSKEDIGEKIWDGKADIGAVPVLVLKLRRKLNFVINVIGSIENGYGTGYYIAPPETEDNTE